MQNTVDAVALLKPLFDAYKVKMKPASKRSLSLFRSRADERKIPHEVVAAGWHQ